MVKHFIGNIIEQHGEFTAKISVVFSTQKGENTEEIFSAIVADWYGIDHSDEEKEEGIFWNDYMSYQAGGFHQITKATYQELTTKRVFSDVGISDASKMEVKRGCAIAL